MSLTTLYPGVYVQEIPSGVRAITGVATSITAFVGRTRWGPTNTPVVVNGFADYERRFGGIWAQSTVSFAVRDFFANGGGQAVVVRLENDATPATVDLGDLQLVALSGGTWANRLTVSVSLPDAADLSTQDVAKSLGVAVADLFTLVVDDPSSASRETLRNLVVTRAHPRNVKDVLSEESQLVRVVGDVPDAPPAATDDPVPVATDGNDGAPLAVDSYIGAGLEADHQGLWALDGADLFNLLCIPPPTREQDTAKEVYSSALEYCVQRRAMLVVDPPTTLAVANASEQLTALNLSGPAARNAALYFPRVVQRDPTAGGRRQDFVPCGAVAGVMARTDATRGYGRRRRASTPPCRAATSPQP
jgi:phage tail sheath protein FI